MGKSIQKSYPLNEFYSNIYKRYDLINRLFTFGLDKKWRKHTARTCMTYRPEKVMDLCCGTGDMVLEITKYADKQVTITGYDFNAEMLQIAKNKIVKRSLKHIEFIQGDAAAISFSNNSFDCMTIAFGFRNLCYNNSQSKKHLKEMNRVLKKKGKLLILESGVPSNLLTRFLSRLYLFLFLIPLGGLLSGNWKAYRYLAKSSSNFYTIDEIESLLLDSGFKIIKTRRFFMGAANLIVAEKASEE